MRQLCAKADDKVAVADRVGNDAFSLEMLQSFVDEMLHFRHPTGFKQTVQVGSRTTVYDVWPNTAACVWASYGITAEHFSHESIMVTIETLKSHLARGGRIKRCLANSTVDVDDAQDDPTLPAGTGATVLAAQQRAAATHAVAAAPAVAAAVVASVDGTTAPAAGPTAATQVPLDAAAGQTVGTASPLDASPAMGQAADPPPPPPLSTVESDVPMVQSTAPVEMAADPADVLADGDLLEFGDILSPGTLAEFGRHFAPPMGQDADPPPPPPSVEMEVPAVQPTAPVEVAADPTESRLVRRGQPARTASGIDIGNGTDFRFADIFDGSADAAGRGPRCDLPVSRGPDRRGSSGSVSDPLVRSASLDTLKKRRASNQAVLDATIGLVDSEEPSPTKDQLKATLKAYKEKLHACQTAQEMKDEMKSFVSAGFAGVNAHTSAGFADSKAHTAAVNEELKSHTSAGVIENKEHMSTAVGNLEYGMREELREMRYDGATQNENLLNAVREEGNSMRSVVREEGGATRSVVTEEHGKTRTEVEKEGKATRSAVKAEARKAREQSRCEIQALRCEMHALLTQLDAVDDAEDGVSNEELLAQIAGIQQKLDEKLNKKTVMEQALEAFCGPSSSNAASSSEPTTSTRRGRVPLGNAANLVGRKAKAKPKA